MEQGKPHRWIPTEYLKSFVTGKPDLGQVDTAAILCDGQQHSTERGQHDFTEPAESTQNKLRAAPPAKRISVAAWEEIVKLQGLTGS